MMRLKNYLTMFCIQMDKTFLSSSLLVRLIHFSNNRQKRYHFMTTFTCLIRYNTYESKWYEIFSIKSNRVSPVF